MAKLAALVPRPRMHAVLCRAVEQQERVSVEGHLESDGQTHQVRCTAEPIPGTGAQQGLLLVSFDDLSVVEGVMEIERDDTEEPAARQLERELRDTRRELDLATAQLQSSVEEYRAKHEEMLSLNEELLSSNEELEAAKEEQESLNEEMATIHQETAEKNVQLRSANEDLHNLFSSTGIPTIFLDIDLKVRRFTPSVEQVMHLMEADQARSIEHIKERYAGGQTADTARAVLDEGRTITTEVEVDNGHWYRRVMAPYLSIDGEVCGVCITFEDVTAQKSALRVSDAARAQAESIVRTVRTPVLIVDEQHRIVSANPAFLRLPGIGNRTIEGMSLETLAVDDEWIYRDISVLVKLVRRERRPLHDHEMQVNGVSLMVNADVMIHGGVAEQVLVALEDVTVHHDFKRASMDRAAEQQAQALRKDEWIAMLGHELRNPLGAVSTAVSLLSAGIDSEEERQQIVNLMQRQVQQVDVLLDSLLDAARIVAGKLEIVSEPLDLVELLTGVVEARRLNLKPHQSLQLDTPLPSGVIVLGDRTRLIEVADNLLTNASKFIPSNGEIRVCVTVTDGWGQFSVQDNGMGITVDLMPRIFEMFAQGERGEHTTGLGLGLGLPLVKRLVELHEGEIDVHSEGEGCGSEFVVRLPLAAQGSTIAAEETATEPRRILVVDDHSDAADILIRLLRRLGHEAQSANDGLAALALTEEFDPDIVLLDIGMAGMDGYEVATRLRAQSVERHIIALTGYRRDEERLRAAGFNNHLSKPLSTARLRRALADLDERQRGGRRPFACARDHIDSSVSP